MRKEMRNGKRLSCTSGSEHSDENTKNTIGRRKLRQNTFIAYQSTMLATMELS